MDSREFRRCMGHFATGVTVVTSEADNRVHGFTVNSFTSVSLEPMLVLISVDRKTKALHILEDNKFIVNILKDNQEDTAMHFAGRPKDPAPFEWEQGQLGKRIKNSLAYIECDPWAAYDGGDHVLYLGEVKHFEYREGNPLLYYTGKFDSLSSK